MANAEMHSESSDRPISTRNADAAARPLAAELFSNGNQDYFRALEQTNQAQQQTRKDQELSFGLNSNGTAFQSYELHELTIFDPDAASGENDGAPNVEGLTKKTSDADSKTLSEGNDAAGQKDGNDSDRRSEYDDRERSQTSESSDQLKHTDEPAPQRPEFQPDNNDVDSSLRLLEALLDVYVRMHRTREGGIR